MLLRRISILLWNKLLLLLLWLGIVGLWNGRLLLWLPSLLLLLLLLLLHWRHACRSTVTPSGYGCVWIDHHEGLFSRPKPIALLCTEPESDGQEDELRPNGEDDIEDDEVVLVLGILLRV